MENQRNFKGLGEFNGDEREPKGGCLRPDFWHKKTEFRLES